MKQKWQTMEQYLKFNSMKALYILILQSLQGKFDTVDSRYLAPVGSQNSRARVEWFSRYLALSREGHDSRIQDHRLTLPGV